LCHIFCNPCHLLTNQEEKMKRETSVSQLVSQSVSQQGNALKE